MRVLLQSVVGRVRFADNELETVSKSERRRVQPLLGYDWIAGKLINSEMNPDE